MGNIYQLNSVSDFNALNNIPTYHPLVTVLDIGKVNQAEFRKHEFSMINYGMYGVILKGTKFCDLRYGKKYYDHQEDTLLFIGPGQVVGVATSDIYDEPAGLVLLFHPDIIKGTSLAKKMSGYSFFDYDTSEALHISEMEKKIVVDWFEKLQYELQHSIDKHSKTLIVSYLELFLNYCVRFYDRQFITRDNANKGILEKFQTLLNSYFASEKPQSVGLPSVAYCAGELCLSPNYFGDLIKKETGRSAQEYIQEKIIDVAKERIFDHDKSISEIAYDLGFKHLPSFTRLFKQKVGMTPHDYRSLN